MAKSKKQKFWEMKSNDSGGGMVYFIGLVGAAIYNFQAANDLWTFVLAVPKAIIWPGYIVYKLLETFYGVVN